MEEAIEVGKMLNVRYTILTHFSQRYPKNVNHDQGARNEEISTVTLQERAGSYKTFVCAHDLMKIKFDHLDAICQLREDIEACFVDEDDSFSFCLKWNFSFTRELHFHVRMVVFRIIVIAGLLLDEFRLYI